MFNKQLQQSFSRQDAKPAKKNIFLFSKNLASFAPLREPSFARMRDPGFHGTIQIYLVNI